MAVVGGITSSAPVQGVTVSGPADVGPPTGAGIMAINGKWVIDPGESFVTQALGVLGATGNIDWTVAGYFSFTTTASTNLTLTFGLTGNTGVLSATPGQFIKIRITSSAATVATITWPATIAWIGMLTGTSGSSQVAPVLIASKLLDVTLVCTAGGSAPTFDGVYMTGT